MTNMFSVSKNWMCTFTASPADRRKERPDARILESGRECVRLYCEPDRIRLEVRTYARDNALLLSAPLKETTKFQLIWRGYRVVLMTNDEEVDEEWPIGDCISGEMAVVETTSSLVQEMCLSDAPAEKEEPSRSFVGGQYYAPKQGEYNVGDCMPFFHDGVYHAYFLKDRHEHTSKWGLGAHQFAHISSQDLIHWESHPLAIPITHPWEGSICTGSFLFAKDKYYAFYAVRMSDYTSAKISWATSEDGIHYEKSEQYFTLEYPYETTSARDPEVFLGADGKYHMLVTTDYLAFPVAERRGCLAHLISEDLEHWEQLPPFYLPGYTDQPECADYFEWNGWYYLIFGNYGCGKYRYSKEPFGPWIKPENEIFDSPLYRVPKTAAFTDGRRIASGFVTLPTEGGSYAGNMIFRELVQHEDGTLSTKQVSEMLPPLQGESVSCELKADAIYAYQLEEVTDFTEETRLSIKAVPSDRTTTYGVALEVDGEQFELRVEPFRGRVSITPMHFSPYKEIYKNTLYNVKDLEQETTLSVVWHHGLLDLCVNGERTLICRVTDWAEQQKGKLSCFVKDGACRFEIEK